VATLGLSSVQNKDLLALCTILKGFVNIQKALGWWQGRFLSVLKF